MRPFNCLMFIASMMTSPLIANPQFHAAESALLKWWIFFESENPDYPQHLAALDESIVINSVGREWRGRQSYLETLKSPYFIFGKNAHHVRKLKMRQLDGEVVLAKAEVLAQVTMKSGELNSQILRYDFIVRKVKNLDPKITRISISKVTDSDEPFSQTLSKNLQRLNELQQRMAKQYHDSSSYNLVRSFVHKWYFIFDTLPKEAKLEVLVAKDPISITIMDTFTTLGELKTWYSSARQTKMANSHWVKLIDVVSEDEESLTIDIYLTWQNIRDQSLNSLPMRNRMHLLKSPEGLRLKDYKPASLAPYIVGLKGS